MSGIEPYRIKSRFYVHLPSLHQTWLPLTHPDTAGALQADRGKRRSRDRSASAA